MKVQILKLKNEHPDWGYKLIARHIGCSPNTVKYHLHPTAAKDTKKRAYRYKEINPLCARITHFHEIREKKKNFDKITDGKTLYRRQKRKSLFTTSELLTYLGENPKCYLTGQPIDLDDLSSYEFDHRVPVSKGGDNSLTNLGLCIPDANVAKGNLLLPEFLELCKRVLLHHGYGVTDESCHRNTAVTGRDDTFSPRSP